MRFAPSPLVAVASSLIASTLHGLHAAHEARGDADEPLEIVHRDVSPPNILVGSDGIPRLLDFGIAKALGRMHSTPSGEIKGKLGYVAPEQLHASHVDRRTDVYGASAVLWEALTGAALFDGPSEPAIVHRVLYDQIEAPSAHRKDVPESLDAIVLKGLARGMTDRFSTAHEMALAIERCTRLATQSEIATWLQEIAGDQLAARARHLLQLQAAKPEPAPSREQTEQTRRMQAAPVAAPEPWLAELRPRRTRSWAAFGLLTALLLAAAWAATAAPSSRRWLAHQAFDVTSAETSVAHANAAVPEPAPVPEPAVAPEAKPASTEPKPQPPGAAVTREPVKRALRKAAATPAQPKAETLRPADPCNLFYTVDARGIRHPKPECL